MDSLAKDERDIEAERLEREELDELIMMFQEADWEREYQKQLDEEFKTRVYRECEEQDDYDDMTWWLEGGWYGQGELE